MSEEHAAAAAVVLTGASGYLGHHLAACLRARGTPFVTAGRRLGDALALDLADPDSVGEAFDGTVVLHAAAMSSVGGCNAEPDAAEIANAVTAGRLAERARRLLYVSTDLVFGGDAAPYAAIDAPDPRNAYGRSKAAGEQRVLDAGRGRHAVVRLPLLFGPSFDGRRGATDMLRRSAREGLPLTLYTNEFRTPLHVALAADALVSLVQQEAAAGILHLAGSERISRAELAERFLTMAEDAEPGPWTPGECEDPERPRDVSLHTDVALQEDLDAMLARS